MTREEVESKIIEKFEEIIDTVKEYEPKTEYFSISMVNGNIHGYNDYFNEEEGRLTKKIDFGEVNFWKELPKE